MITSLTCSPFPRSRSVPLAGRGSEFSVAEHSTDPLHRLPPRAAPYGSHCVPYPAEAQGLSIDITIANCGYHSITQRLVMILEKRTFGGKTSTVRSFLNWIWLICDLTPAARGLPRLVKIDSPSFRVSAETGTA